jgi:hypothetical protein
LSSSDEGPTEVTSNPLTPSQLETILRGDVRNNSISSPLYVGIELDGIPVPTTALGDGSLARIHVDTSVMDAAGSVPEPSALVLAGIACTILAACHNLKRRTKPTGAVCCVALAVALAGTPRAQAGSVLLTLESLEKLRTATGMGDSSQGLGQLDQGAQSFQRVNFEACLKRLGQVVKAHPELPPAQVLFAEPAFQNNESARIRPALERASAETPARPDVYIQFGNLALLEGRPTDAAVHFEYATALTSSQR